jgi:hypothetical protein
LAGRFKICQLTAPAVQKEYLGRTFAELLTKEVAVPVRA